MIVGCDRVAANGDVANKIGTYALAIAARHHGVPFYVAGPRSTLDPAHRRPAPTIEIEQRDGGEVRAVAGLDVTTAVWNPAFDVTPAELITGLITDAGVLRAPYGPAIAGRPGLRAAVYLGDGEVRIEERPAPRARARARCWSRCAPAASAAAT